MRNYYTIAAVLCLIYCMTGCIKEGYDSENCPGAVRINYNWFPDTFANDSLYISVVQGDKIWNLSTGADDSGVDIDLENGSYEVVAAETAKNIKVEGIAISVDPSGGQGYPEPGVCTGGADTLVVDDGQSESVVDIPMVRQVRPLIVNVRFTGSGAITGETKAIRSAGISHVSGIVSGVTFSRHINYGFPPVNGNPRNPAYTTGEVEYDLLANTAERFYTDRHNLLGIDGEASQELELAINFENGYSETLHLDVTSRMYEFHTKDITQPWVINIVIDVTASFEVSITDWTAGPESWMEAQ